MKKYLHVKNIKINRPKREFRTLLDKISFGQLFIIWMSIIIAIGFLYYFLHHAMIGNGGLLSTTGNAIDVLDTVYFSFITATSTGFGDIVPLGYFKIIALSEVIVSLTIFAIVTSKLVSIKQTAILNEIYDISFSDKVDGIRSSLYLFRIDLDKIMVKIDEKTIRKREISELWMNFSFFEHVLVEFTSVMNREQTEHEYLKKIEPVNMEIIMNSINSSFAKIEELLHLFVDNKMDWKRTLTVNFIQSCLEHANIIFKKVESGYSSKVKNLKQLIEDFNKREDAIMQMVK